MTSIDRDLLFIVIQYLDEQNLKNAARKMEMESKIHFNVKYYEQLVLGGEWHEAETYMGSFVNIDDNNETMKIFFEMRKQKYLEALDRKDRAAALEILMKDLKPFGPFNEDVFKELTFLLTLENFRAHNQLASYRDSKSGRADLWKNVHSLIQSNPALTGKLRFPEITPGRLRTLVNQSLNWQHQLCKQPIHEPDIGSLIVDHNCPSKGGTSAVLMQKGLTNSSFSIRNPYQSSARISNPIQHPYKTAMAHISSSFGAIASDHPSAFASMAASSTAMMQPRQHIVPFSGSRTNSQYYESENLVKRHRVVSSEQLKMPVSSQHQSRYTKEDLPKLVSRTLNEASNVTSMKFHPEQLTTILVGTSVGDISIWEVGSKEKLAHKKFSFWDSGRLSQAFQVAIAKDPKVSVNRCAWNAEGNAIGVAFSKHVVQIYSCVPVGELKPHHEIDAHTGSVNDIAFIELDSGCHVITAGEDREIKVWHLIAGTLTQKFGHDSPVFCICPQYKSNFKYIFSTSVDGKIKAFLFESSEPKVDYDAPGGGCTRMVYSDDGSRLFSCGRSKEGNTILVEWDEREGAIKHVYDGFLRKSCEVVHFDTTRNNFLAAGADNEIKFWDMDHIDSLAVTDAGGDLLASPCLGFNKDGSLLAVTTLENKIKILANSDGLRFLKMIEDSAKDGGNVIDSVPTTNVAGSLSAASNGLLMTGLNGADSNIPMDGKGKTKECGVNITNKWKPVELTEPSQFRIAKLPEQSPNQKVLKIIYTNSACAIISLNSGGEIKQWRWITDRQSFKATTDADPKIWNPMAICIEVNESEHEEMPCDVIMSKNDSYILSAYGGVASLFNAMSHRLMLKFQTSLPIATSLAFHPLDNNIIILGMDNSNIEIFNARENKTLKQIPAHKKRITGLAFSSVLHILVSSGSDSQLLFWSIDEWEMQKSVYVKSPIGRSSTSFVDTNVQFHNNLPHLLVVQEWQLVVYDASTYCTICQWTSQTSVLATISAATYSCDCLLVYAVFSDGNVTVFDAKSLTLVTVIARSAYMGRFDSGNAKPLSIAANPKVPGQFTIGMSDGGIFVMEPLKSEGKWGSGQTDLTKATYCKEQP